MALLLLFADTLC